MKTEQNSPAVAVPVECPVRAVWSSGLKCCWISWTVVDDGILRLDMPDNNCCDMTGAIKCAEALSPFVWRIDTYAGDKPDTMYFLRDGQWQVVDERTAKLLYAVYPAA